MFNWKELVGKRCLLGDYFGSEYEGKIMEVSPSDKYVKVQYESGNSAWKNCLSLMLMEVLEDKKEEKGTLEDVKRELTKVLYKEVIKMLEKGNGEKGVGGKK
jgi:hypothetical protein